MHIARVIPQINQDGAISLGLETVMPDQCTHAVENRSLPVSGHSRTRYEARSHIIISAS